MRRAHLFSRRASALVVALGVLLVLAVLAISFARLTAIEGQAASVRVDEVRARFLAFAGIERVLAEVRAASRAPWDGPDAAWFYRGEPGRPAGNGTPLEFASLPSFFAGNTVDGNPEIAANGNGRPYSGALPTSYETLGDTYVVKVLDAASMIDLNAPLDPRRRVADEPLVSMLVNLSRALDPARPPLDSSEAQMILAYRESLPFRRFASKKDILLVPGGPVTPAEFALLADFVTVHAWADPSGVAPADPALVPVEGTPVLGRRPTGRPLAQRRRPVDLNTAPPEVLAAVLAGVQAVVVDQDVDREPAGGISWQATGIAARTPPVSFGQAQSLARAIVAHREASPFRTWSEFRSFLAQMVDDGAVERLQADAIYANADPNPDTHRANPDAGVYRHIDKFDLVQSTTEFCFSSMGVFEIESIGRVTQNGGLIEAEAWIGTVVETHVLVRETTQSQFDRGTISTYRLEEPIFFSPQVAVITEEDLRINGSPRILGAAGSVHSNANLELLGSTLVEIDATATGTYEQGPQCQVLGESGGGYPREIIPLLRPSDFRASADYVFSASGKVYDRSGREVGDGRYLDFRFQAGTWKWNGGQQPTGTLWFDGHVEIQARTGRGSTWEVTIVATGHISLGGTPRVRPTEVSRLTLIAGTDVSVSGNPGAVIEGLLYAGEQIDLGGNVEFRGVAMAKGLGATDRLVTGNVIQGSVIFRYNGGLVFQSETVVTNLPTLRAHPEPDAEVELGGPRVRIPGAQDFDGWISLATATTSRAVLGPTPYRDRLLARWTARSLDADAGGGPLDAVVDSAGPTVASVLGEGPLGCLLADGVYSEIDSTLAYVAPGNVGPLQGTLAFWVKPSWDTSGPDRSNRSHHLLSMSRQDDVGTQSFQLAQVGSWSGGWSDLTGFHFERSTLENSLAERLVYSSWTPPGHRWTHVVLAWDFTEQRADRAIAVYVDGVELPGAIREFTGSYDLLPEELLRAPITRGNLLRLGERLGFDFGLPAASAEATFDELVSLPVRMDADWAAAAYAQGRFYSAGKANFVSAALTVPPGSELLWASWTVREPLEGAPPVTLTVAQDGLPIASTSDPAGFSIGRAVTGEIRYSLIFLDAAAPRSLYASAAVDDVTLAFATRPRILSWEES